MVETMKEEAQRLLLDVPGEKSFWVNGGQVLHNLEELGEALRTMSDENYIYHANGQKNDFITWVREVIGDEKLAGKLKVITTRAQMARAVSSRVILLSKRLA
jgi:hypothetical protein